MKERLQFLLLYMVFWVIFFTAARFIFLSYHILDTKQLTLDTIFNIFYHGSRMDLSMAAYLSIIPFLFIVFSNFIKKSRLENWIFTYTFIMVLITLFLIVADLQVYNTWNYRIDATPLYYLKNPHEAWASVSSSPLLQLFVSFLLLLIVASYIVYRIISNNLNTWNHVANFPFMLVALFLTAALIIPIRGGLQLTPLNQSSVYFSTNNFANVAAINAPWNFFRSILVGDHNKENPYTYLPKEEGQAAIDELFKASGKTEKVLKTDRPNIILIIWESFTKKTLTAKVGDVEITPNFNALRKEGIYFSNLYATGERTDKGLVGVLSGYPSQPTQSILKEPSKSAKLPIISKDLEEKGYATSFYYGGEDDFFNIKSYLYSAKFQKIVNKSDFEEKDLNSKWGAHDHVVFNKFLQENKHRNQPFFSTILTLSSHEPFEVPIESKIKGTSEEELFLKAMSYSDKSLGDFIAEAKKQTWWDNTLIVVVSDHGHRLPKTNNRIDDFKISMLWLGGALNKTNAENTKVGSQTDFAATLLNQLSLKSGAYQWSKNLFDTSVNPWAYFTYNDGFGMVLPKKYYLFDNVGKKFISQNGDVSKHDLILGKALQQRTYQDYLDK